MLLVGGRTGNPLIAELLASGSVLTDFSPNDPGPGRGLITWVPGAFDGAHDVVLALAADEPGLAAVEAALRRLRDDAPAHAAEPLHVVRQAFVPQDVRRLRTGRDGALAVWFAQALPAPASAPVRNVLTGTPAPATSRWAIRGGVCTYALAAIDAHRFVVTADSWDRNLFLFDGDRVVRALHADTPFVHQVGVSPSGTIVTAEGMKPACVVAYARDGANAWELPVAYDGAYYTSRPQFDNAEPDYLVLSPDRKTVYAVGRDLVLHARDIDTGRDRWTTPLGNPEPDKVQRWTPALALSGDGKVLVLAVHARARQAQKQYSDAETEAVRDRIDPRIVRVRSGDGHIEWTRRIRSRGMIQYQRRWTPTVPTQDGQRLGLDATGARLAMCDIQGNLRVWGAAGDELRTFPRCLYTDTSVFDLTFSPNGRYLAACPLEQYQHSSHTVGSNVNRLYLFDLEQDRRWVFDPVEQISHAVFDAAGRRLLWAAWDGVVRAWDLARAEEVAATSVGPGARLLAMAGGDTVAATYFGDVFRIAPDGTVTWRRNLTPLCYPQPLYEPEFLRDRKLALHGAELGRRLARAEPVASPSGRLVWLAPDSGEPLTLPVDIDVPGRYRLALGIEKYDGATLEVRVGDRVLGTVTGPGTWETPECQHVRLEQVRLGPGDTALTIAGARPSSARTVTRAPFGLWYVEPPSGTGTPAHAWRVLGPLPGQDPMPPIDPAQAPRDGTAGRPVAWREHRTGDGYVDLLMLATPPYTNVRAYASTIVTSPDARPARIWLGHNLHMAMWNNGREVYRSTDVYWWAPDATSITVDLDKGENHVLVCVNQGPKSYGDYGFWFAISNPGDLTLTAGSRATSDASSAEARTSASRLERPSAFTAPSVHSK